MLPGAALGVAAGWFYADRVNEAQLMAALGAITLAFGLYRLWIERGGRIVAASRSPGWVGSLFGVVPGFPSQLPHPGGPPLHLLVTPARLPPPVLHGSGPVLVPYLNGKT